MKAPARTTRRIPPPTKKRTRAHSTLIYRAHKEVGPAAFRSPGILASRRLSVPKPVLLRLVSSEAFRLSKTNKRKVITLQEISAAVTSVRRRIQTKAAA